MDSERSLSDVPKNIIHRIFSFVDHLTNKEALQLGLRLSKYLLAALQSRPKLVFDYRRQVYKSWESLQYDTKPFNRETAEKSSRQELNYVLSMMNTDDIQLDTLILYADPLLSSDIDLYDRCVRLAIKKGIKKLQLTMATLDYYVLPQVVFESESLEELGLDEACCLQPDKGRVVVLPNLKRLFILGYCSVKMEDLGTIIQACPSLEHLKVHNAFTDGTGTVKIANLDSLKRLEIRLFRPGQCLEVNAMPNLESIHCSWYETTNKIDLCGTEYPNLKSLNVVRGIVEDPDHFFEANFSNKFPILEDLVFEASSLPERMSLSSTSLRRIKLVDTKKVLQEARFDVPNLVHFEYEDSCLAEWLGRFLPKLHIAAGSSWYSSDIRLTMSENEIGPSWFLNLNAFLAALDGCADTRISVDFNCHRLRKSSALIQSVSGQLPWITEFTVTTSHSFAVAIVDSIMLTCKPRILTFRGNHPSTHSLRLVYEKLIAHHCDVHMSFGANHDDDMDDEDPVPTISDRFKNWDTFIQEYHKVGLVVPTSFYLDYLA